LKIERAAGLPKKLNISTFLMFMGVAMYDSDELKDLYYYEMLGRALASGTSYRPIGEVYNWINALIERVGWLNQEFSRMAVLVGMHDVGLSQRLNAWGVYVLMPLLVMLGVIRKAMKRSFEQMARPSDVIDYYFKEFGASIYLVANEHMVFSICPSCKHLAETTCCYLEALNKVKYDDPSLLINDITAVYHRVIECYVSVLQRFGDIQTVSDKSKVSPNVSKLAQDALIVWDNAIHEFLPLGIYHPSDYDALTGFAFDNIVELRVGSAVGHLTKIDFNNGIVDYYDTDTPVVLTLGRMFEKAGGALKSYEGDHAVYDVSRANPTMVSLILSLATSMDYRFGDVVSGIATDMFHYRWSHASNVYPGKEMSLEQAEKKDYNLLLTTWLSERPLVSTMLKPIIQYALKQDRDLIKKHLDTIFQMSVKAFERWISQGKKWFPEDVLSDMPEFRKEVVDFCADIHYLFLRGASR